MKVVHPGAERGSNEVPEIDEVLEPKSRAFSFWKLASVSELFGSRSWRLILPTSPRLRRALRCTERRADQGRPRCPPPQLC